MTELPRFPVERVYLEREHLRVEVLPRGVVRLVLARPEVRNAFDAAMLAELSEALDRLAVPARAEDLRLLLLEGEGEAFCAGGDLAYMRAQGSATAEENLEDARALGRMFHGLASFPVPVVCYVQGAAIGGGLGLTACADFVLADPATVFATPEVLLGLVPGVISPYVVRKLGLAHAAPLMLAGRRVKASEGLQSGLVQRLVEPSQSPTEALTLVLEQFLAAGPQAARSMKRLLLETSPLPDPELLDLTARAIAAARTSAEARAGMRAFFDKVPPDWAR